MKTDTQNLRVKDGDIVLRPSALKRQETICDYCVLKDLGCRHEPMIERCGHFVPALSFVDETGLTGSFSTYRGSAIWYDRARAIHKTHKTVALTKINGDFIGFAKLIDAHRHGFGWLMDEHAITNHLMKDRGFTKQEAAIELTAWIRKNLGLMHVKDPFAIGTVLSLERIDERIHEAPGEA